MKAKVVQYFSFTIYLFVTFYALLIIFRDGLSQSSQMTAISNAIIDKAFFFFKFISPFWVNQLCGYFSKTNLAVVLTINLFFVLIFLLIGAYWAFLSLFFSGALVILYLFFWIILRKREMMVKSAAREEPPRR